MSEESLDSLTKEWNASLAECGEKLSVCQPVSRPVKGMPFQGVSAISPTGGKKKGAADSKKNAVKLAADSKKNAVKLAGAGGGFGLNLNAKAKPKKKVDSDDDDW